MREIVMDTETTGLDPTQGHKVVEIGAVELFNHIPTGRTFHQYINPKRQMPKEAFDIHGLSIEFLNICSVASNDLESLLIFNDTVGLEKIIASSDGFTSILPISYKALCNKHKAQLATYKSEF